MSIMKEYKVGLLIPWVNTAMEDEIPLLVNKRVGLHWSRIKPSKGPKDGHDDTYLDSMIEDIPNALSRFGELKLDLVILGCTSATITNEEKNLSIIWKNQKARYVSTMDAMVAQLRKYGAKKVMLFAPYTKEMISSEISLLERFNITVSKAVRIDYFDEIRHIRPVDIFNTFMREYKSGPDAILFSCTGMYTLEAFKKIHRGINLSVPLISSNSAIGSIINDMYSSNIIKGRI